MTEKNIFIEYHSKDFAGNKAFILDKVHKTNIQRRRKRDTENSRKKQSYEYHLDTQKYMTVEGSLFVNHFSLEH